MYIKNSTKIALTYIGAIVGAGFATGQEIYQFFTIFGPKGQLGGIISTIGFMFFGYLYLKIVYNNPINNYFDLLKLICGKKIARIFDVCISLFLFGSFVIMVAAAYTIFSVYMIPNKLIAYLIIATVLWVSFLRGAKGIVQINSYLIPVLVFAVTILCLTNLFKGIPVYSSTGLVPSNYALSGITYVSYNLIIGMVVLSSLKSEIYNKSVIILTPIISGLILGIMLFLIISATGLIVKPSELPITDLAQGMNKYLNMTLVLAIGIAILTSALASGFGLISRAQQSLKLKYNTWVTLLVLLSIPLSLFGFASLVAYVYPFFGFLNIIVMILTVKHYIGTNVKGFWRG